MAEIPAEILKLAIEIARDILSHRQKPGNVISTRQPDDIPPFANTRVLKLIDAWNNAEDGHQANLNALQKISDDHGISKTTQTRIRLAMELQYNATIKDMIDDTLQQKNPKESICGIRHRKRNENPDTV